MFGTGPHRDFQDTPQKHAAVRILRLLGETEGRGIQGAHLNGERLRSLAECRPPRLPMSLHRVACGVELDELHLPRVRAERRVLSPDHER